MSIVKQNVEKAANRKIAAGTILGYAALIVSILSGLFFTPWIKRTIGNEMYGIYTLAQSIMNLFLMDFGLSTSMNAYLSKYRAEGNIRDESRFLSATLKIYLFLDLLMFIIFTALYFLIEHIYSGLTPEEIPILKNVFLILIGVCLLTFPSSVFRGVLQAYEEFGPLKGIEICNKCAYIALTACSLFLNWGIYGVVGAYAASSLVNAALIYLFERYKLKKRISFRERTTWQEVKSIISFSFYGFVASIASRLIFTVVPSILGIVSDSVNISVFGICSTLEGYVYGFGSMMSGFFLPKIARLLAGTAEEDFGDKLTDLGIKVGKIQLSFVLLIFVGFIAIGSDFVDLWLDFDPAYAPVYAGTILLIVYELINVPQVVFTNAVFLKRDFLKPYSLCNLLLSLVNVVLVFIFGYLFGAFGSCIAICVSHAAELIVFNILFKKYLKVSLYRFFKDTYIGFIPAAVCSLTGAILFHLFLPFGAFANILIGGFSTVAIYVSLVWIGFGKKETITFLTRIRNRLFRRE